VKLKSIAYHLGFRVDLKAIRKALGFTLVKREHTFLLYKMSELSYLYIKEYGSVVFINCSADQSKEVLNLIIGGNLEEVDLLSDTWHLLIKPNTECVVDFEYISVPELTIDIAYIIMLNFAQSVALDYYHIQVNELIEITQLFSLELAKSR
jgi:required for meiotic nuclear division protein 1